MFGASQSVQQQQRHLNKACHAHNKEYSAMLVSWNDNSRQQGSCWGSNITDARLKGKDGEDFLVVRPSNFNERIGKVRACDVAVITGNSTPGAPLQPATLDQVLCGFDHVAGYASQNGNVPPNTSLRCDRDDEIGIRFQVVFLPVPKTANQDGKVQFYPDTYNYQTRSADDPKNIILLCTSQGTFVQQDGPGSQPQYLHQMGPHGDWNSHYLEAMMTRHKVSMEQEETAEEREEAIAQNKAVSTAIGTRSMGLGFNRLMTIQIPLEQQQSQFVDCFDAYGMSDDDEDDCFDGPNFLEKSTKKRKSTSGRGGRGGSRCREERDRCRRRSRSRERSEARAARVSYGNMAGPMTKLGLSKCARDTKCSITITVQFYFVYDEGANIKEEDIRKAIDVCEEAYRGCQWDGHLMDRTHEVAFAKKPMTAAEKASVFNKIVTQPATGPPSVSPAVTQWPGGPLPTSPAANMTIPRPPANSSVFAVAYNPWMGVPQQVTNKAKAVSASNAAYLWLHDVGLQYLDAKHLQEAFHIFRVCNDMHIQVKGVPAKTALYNQACCLSLAVETQIQSYITQVGGVTGVDQMTRTVRSTIGDAYPLLPSVENALDQPASVLINHRMDTCVTYLANSVVNGYHKAQHMQLDADLNALRELRAAQFQKIVVQAV